MAEFMKTRETINWKPKRIDAALAKAQNAHSTIVQK